jgi:hypothetical protein
MHAEAQKEHEWLHRLIGEWTYESDCAPGEEKPVGTETVSALGDVWVVAHGRGGMGGGEAQTMMTLGFDPAKGRYVGTWVGSPMTYLWVYDGELDAGGTMLTLSSEGPSFTDPTKTGKYRDIIEMKGPDHRLLRAEVQGEDGVWQPLMTVHYHRKA